MRKTTLIILAVLAMSFTGCIRKVIHPNPSNNYPYVVQKVQNNSFWAMNTGGERCRAQVKREDLSHKFWIFVDCDAVKVGDLVYPDLIRIGGDRDIRPKPETTDCSPCK